MLKLGSFRIFGLADGGRRANWVRFAFLRSGRLDGNPDFEIPGAKRDAAVWWAWLVTPPVFGVALSPITQRIIP